MINKTKIIELNGYKFKIKKLNAFTASYIAVQIGFSLAGGLINVGNTNKVDMLQKAISGIDKDKFIEIQKDCLSAVEILNNINGSEMPEALILNNGSLSHKELENDFMTIILLTIEVVMFNVEGFFGEKGLQSLTNSLQTNSKQ